MQRTKKRKLRPPPISTTEKGKASTGSAARPINGRDVACKEPFPTHVRPNPEECRAVRDDLLALHGFPEQFAKYRRNRQLQLGVCEVAPSVDDDEEEESVLDGLVKTVLSQNTTDTNCQRTFASLKSNFPAWEDVLAAESKPIEDAIRCGGLAPTKAKCIKNILSSLLRIRGKLCLEYLRDFSVNEMKAELSHFKGIGPKTVISPKLTNVFQIHLLFPDKKGLVVVACVLMFQLQQDDFPVDTHVFEISKTIGWIPPGVDRNKTYLHLNKRIPNELKFDLNCLLFTHGKLCHKCSRRKDHNKQQKNGPFATTCPLLNYCFSSSVGLPNSSVLELQLKRLLKEVATCPDDSVPLKLLSHTE